MSASMNTHDERKHGHGYSTTKGYQDNAGAREGTLGPSTVPPSSALDASGEYYDDGNGGEHANGNGGSEHNNNQDEDDGKHNENGRTDDDTDDDADNGLRRGWRRSHIPQCKAAPQPSACTRSAAIAASATYRRLRDLTPATDPYGFRDPRNLSDPLPKPAKTRTRMCGWRVWWVGLGSDLRDPGVTHAFH
jgi:hypothetical protein